MRRMHRCVDLAHRRLTPDFTFICFWWRHALRQLWYMRLPPWDVCVFPWGTPQLQSDWGLSCDPWRLDYASFCDNSWKKKCPDIVLCAQKLSKKKCPYIFLCAQVYHRSMTSGCRGASQIRRYDRAAGFEAGDFVQETSGGGTHRRTTNERTRPIALFSKVVNISPGENKASLCFPLWSPKKWTFTAREQERPIATRCMTRLVGRVHALHVFSAQ